MSKFPSSTLLLVVPILLGSGTAYASAVVLNPASTNVTVTYTLPGTAGNIVVDNFTPTNITTFVYAQSSTVPSWLNVTVSGTGVGGGTVAIPFNFQANAVAGTMQPGNYSSTVTFATTASGYSPSTVSVNVTLVVKAAAPKFACSAVSGGAATTGSLSYSYGSGNALSMSLNCTSTGEEIAFSVGTTSNPASLMALSSSNGIAYPWGSAAINVTFSQQILLQAGPGSALTGVITLTPGVASGASPFVINVNVNVNTGSLTFTGVAPSELPVDTTTDHTVVLSGTGFLPGVSIVNVGINNASYTALDAAHAVVASATSIIVTLDHNTYLKVAHASAAPLNFQVQNGASGTVLPASQSAATEVVVTTAPIIYAITNAASYVQTPGLRAQVSPYEIISIFGANFDSGQGLATNSASASPYVYPATMNNSAGKAVTVAFYTGGHSTALSADLPGTLLGSAPLIFVSNTQINAIVPSGIVGSLSLPATDAANVLVSVNSITNDVAVGLDVLATTPGIFTPSGSGQGIAAVLNQAVGTNAPVLNSQSTPAVHGTTITIFATGLGAPDATGVADAAAGSAAYPASCIATDATGYLGILAGSVHPPTAAYGTTPLGGFATGSGSSFTSLDGAVIASPFLYQNLYAPCFLPASVTVTLTNNSTAAAGTPVVLSGATPIKYAGFVTDSIAGLYQINVALPATMVPALASVGSPVTMTISVNGVASQNGVVVWVQ